MPSISSGGRLAADEPGGSTRTEPEAQATAADRSTPAPRTRGAAAILSEIAQPWNEAGIADALGAVASEFGYRWFAIQTLASAEASGPGMKLLMSNWTEEFARGYQRLGLSRYSLVLRALTADPMPFVWDVGTLYGDDADEAGTPAALMARHGFCGGIYLPVHGITAFNGALAFAGERPEPNEAEAGELHLAAFAVFGMLAACRFEENRRNNPLSRRERDCLKLAMLGKTSSEIGIILSLSESTVSQYLTAATRKMDASNRTHAVALAAQLGYLS